MIAFLKKYKAFIFGLLLFRILVHMATYFELVHIDNKEVLGNVLIFLFGWILISLPIHFFPFLKQHKTISLKLAGLMVLFLAILMNDINSKIPDNPITIVGLIIVFLFFFSTIAPQYFKKHALSIIGIYVLILGYFLYQRIYINDLDSYFQQEKEIKIILATPFFVILLSWFYHQWKWIKTLESKKSKAELSLLKSQINPHFFFNTLNNLYGLTVEKSDDAPNVVLKLSDMMRHTIYMGNEDFVPLKDEIEYLQNYIDLHKIRYQKQVDIVFKHSYETNYEIAPLLFILPLENAIKHGVENLTEHAFVHINLKAKNGDIHFAVENNFEESNVGEDTAGIGLKNLKQRLKLLYPNKHRIKIEAKDSIYRVALKIQTT